MNIPSDRIVKKRNRWAWLHTHSTASDGLDSPLKLAKMAQTLHVHHLALTDHDTLEGYDVLRPLRVELPVAVWGGVEVSIADFGLVGRHLTVLFPDGPALSSYDAMAAYLDRPPLQRTPEALADIPCIVLSGCKGSVLYKHGTSYGEMFEVLDKWQRLFGNRLYIEVQPHFGPFDQILYTSLVQDTGLSLVVTADSHSKPHLPLIDALKIREHSLTQTWQNAVSRTEAIVERLRCWETIGQMESEPIRSSIPIGSLVH